MTSPWLRRLKSWMFKAYQSLILTSVEAFLAALSIMAGLPVLVHPEALSPTSVHALFPPWGVFGWGFMLTVGGLMTLVGILGPVMRIERGGVFILGTTAGIYGLAIILYIGVSGILPSLTYFLFSLAMFARYWVLGRIIRYTNAILARVREEV